MSKAGSKILIVDDEPHNLFIISEYLEDTHHEYDTAGDGMEAWDLLQANPELYSCVLLDWMMPRMDGLEVLRLIKGHDVLKYCPVVIQTARNSHQDHIQGMNAGAYYYLTKPFEEEMLLSIINTATEAHEKYQRLRADLQQNVSTLRHMQSGRFIIKTLDEGRSVAALLANACPDSGRVVLGLSELIINAVEHGNLGIEYAEKTALNERNAWLTEVENRLALPEYSKKRVQVDFRRNADGIMISIEDEGSGFDWVNYLEMTPERSFATHGRGIAIAGSISFSRLEFTDGGSRAEAYIDF
ncbi:MAG: response regulator [Gammaproteobacteria bacterium]|nr:response regulator [Gammaproteobacteria bacterium]